MRILLFGANGQLGTELQQQCRLKGIPIIATSRSESDITDPAQVEASVRAAAPGIIVNAAAYTKVDQAEADTEQALRDNRDGPAVLAAVAKTHCLPLVHLSTDFVFNGEKNSPYLETDPVAPINIYGLSKWEGEQAIRRKLEHHLIIRTSWLFGRFGSNFLKTMLRLANDRESLSVVADQTGNPTCTVDLAEAVLSACARIAEGQSTWGTYHFAGHGATTWHGFAREIIAANASHAGRSPIVRPITTSEYPTAAKRPANSQLDSNLFASTFGTTAKPWELRTKEVVGALADDGMAT